MHNMILVGSLPSFDYALETAAQLEVLNPSISIGIVGNKVDADLLVSTEQAMKVCQEQKYAFQEVSALQGTGVHEFFNAFIDNVAKTFPEQPEVRPLMNRNVSFAERVMVNKIQANMQLLQYLREPIYRESQ